MDSNYNTDRDHEDDDDQDYRDEDFEDFEADSPREKKSPRPLAEFSGISPEKVKSPRQMVESQARSVYFGAGSNRHSIIGPHTHTSQGACSPREGNFQFDMHYHKSDTVQLPDHVESTTPVQRVSIRIAKEGIQKPRKPVEEVDMSSILDKMSFEDEIELNKRIDDKCANLTPSETAKLPTKSVDAVCEVCSPTEIPDVDSSGNKTDGCNDSKEDTAAEEKSERKSIEDEVTMSKIEAKLEARVDRSDETEEEKQSRMESLIKQLVPDRGAASVRGTMKPKKGHGTTGKKSTVKNGKKHGAAERKMPEASASDTTNMDFLNQMTNISSSIVISNRDSTFAGRPNGTEEESLAGSAEEEDDTISRISSQSPVGGGGLGGGSKSMRDSRDSKGDRVSLPGDMFSKFDKMKNTFRWELRVRDDKYATLLKTHNNLIIHGERMRMQLDDMANKIETLECELQDGSKPNTKMSSKMTKAGKKKVQKYMDENSELKRSAKAFKSELARLQEREAALMQAVEELSTQNEDLIAKLRESMQRELDLSAHKTATISSAAFSGSSSTPVLGGVVGGPVGGPLGGPLGGSNVSNGVGSVGSSSSSAANAGNTASSAPKVYGMASAQQMAASLAKEEEAPQPARKNSVSFTLPDIKDPQQQQGLFSRTSSLAESGNANEDASAVNGNSRMPINYTAANLDGAIRRAYTDTSERRLRKLQEDVGKERRKR